MSAIELTAGETKIWARMPDDDRELIEAAVGALLRAWAKWNPPDAADLVLDECPPSAPVAAPPPPLPDEFQHAEPTDEVILAEARAGRYGVRLQRLIEQGNLPVERLRIAIGQVIRPGVSDEEAPTHSIEPRGDG